MNTPQDKTKNDTLLKAQKLLEEIKKTNEAFRKGTAALREETKNITGELDKAGVQELEAISKETAQKFDEATLDYIAALNQEESGS